MINVTIDTPGFDNLMAALGAAGRKALHSAAANGLLVLCREHLRKVSATKHTSAHRLGAAPTGHLEEAARTMVASADDSAGILHITSPGFRRVFGSLTIRAKRAKALTLPLAAEAYGKRVGELTRQGWQVFKSPAKGFRSILMGKAPAGNTVKPLYLLRASVTLPQDRSLLPSGTDMAQAVGNAIITRINLALKDTK